jgi:hypothetical protein
MNMNKDQIALENAYKEIVNENWKQKLGSLAAAATLGVGGVMGGKNVFDSGMEKIRQVQSGFAETAVPNLNDSKGLSDYLNKLQYGEVALGEKPYQFLLNLRAQHNAKKFLSPDQINAYNAIARKQYVNDKEGTHRLQEIEN